jgi:Tfp pilus assembly protein PilO
MIAPSTIDHIGRATLVIVLGAFLVVISHRAVRPLLGAQERVRSLTEAVNILASTEAGIEELSAEIEAVSNELAATKAMLPPTAKLDAFLEQLNQLAAESGVTIEQLRPGDVSSHPLYRDLTIDIRVSGSFADVYALLRRLETGDRLVRIDRLQITGAGRDDACVGQLSIALYFEPQ